MARTSPKTKPPKPLHKTPLRRCSGCGEMKPKKELVRVVRDPEGAVSLDLTGKKSGRGAYVCRDLGCLQKARKARRIERSFACMIPAAVYEAMEEELRFEGEADDDEGTGEPDSE